MLQLLLSRISESFGIKESRCQLYNCRKLFAEVCNFIVIVYTGGDAINKIVIVLSTKTKQQTTPVQYRCNRDENAHNLCSNAILRSVREFTFPR